MALYREGCSVRSLCAIEIEKPGADTEAGGSWAFDHEEGIFAGRENIIVMPAVVHVGEAIRAVGKEDSIEGVIGNDAAYGQDGAMMYTHVNLYVDSG
ncbi:hypothetical protein VM1G_11296 [Cytospora mali]|uniref:Uncharacterized protein n=1 Tax=Cytospora mali TaxID=578113 RepID=A0A194VLD5_CYTMA|nr:hypothetical protein VM1G_11296 [Valsa mali]